MAKLALHNEKVLDLNLNLPPKKCDFMGGHYVTNKWRIDTLLATYCLL